jgi:hypothetical protein
MAPAPAKLGAADVDTQEAVTVSRGLSAAIVSEWATILELKCAGLHCGVREDLSPDCWCRGDFASHKGSHVKR